MRHPLLPLSLLLVVVACSAQGTVIPAEEKTPGPKTTFYGSSVASWAVVEENGSVTGVGFTLPMAAVQSARTALDPGEDAFRHDPGDGFRLTIPDEIRGKTPIDHVDVEYRPVGHGPDAYLSSHFDVRFYRINESAQARIDCRDDNPVEGDLIPDGYVLGKSGRPPAGECYPLVGRLAIPISVPGITKDGGEWDTPADAFGYDDGRLAFIEVAVPRSFLLRKDQGSIAITRPTDIDGWSAFPSQANFVYDRKADAYDVWLEFPPPDAR